MGLRELKATRCDLDYLFLVQVDSITETGIALQEPSPERFERVRSRIGENVKPVAHVNHDHRRHLLQCAPL